MLVRVITIIASSLLFGCSLFGVRSGYEEPSFDVLDTLREDVEVRRYSARLAAEARVAVEDEDEARSEAFRILAGYIFGGNRTSESIEMTAPVEVESEPASASERIAMTVPVETTAGRDEMVMRFFMPARFTRDSLPVPEDSRVRIVEAAGETLAVLRYSGRGRATSVAEREAELLALLEASQWRVVGDAKAYYYDPPWTLPFLRRNEVAVPVRR